jgi:hypothetical protein
VANDLAVFLSDQRNDRLAIGAQPVNQSRFRISRESRGVDAVDSGNFVSVFGAD